MKRTVSLSLTKCMSKNNCCLPSKLTARQLSSLESSKTHAKHVDFAVFGGGVIGSSVAYWLKQRQPNQLSCAVIERDPTVSVFRRLFQKLDSILIIVLRISIQNVRQLYQSVVFANSFPSKRTSSYRSSAQNSCRISTNT